MTSAACLEPYIRKNEDPNELLRLDELIAEGSFGIVYKGFHTTQNAVLAVKIIQLEEDETFDDLVIEIEVLTRCHHENIVGYFGSWRKGDELFIGMELCDGGSAADLYQELDKPLGEKEIAIICRDTLRGLQYLHSVGILHRDIKGANILLKQDGAVKLVDFGVSGKVSPQNPHRNTFIGTPYWMAPEVIENKGSRSPYDGRCDVWSLGITLLELAHAEPPLSELHPMKALFQIPYRTPPALAKPAEWSPAMNDFVKQSLTRDPRQRPSVSQLLSHPFVQSCAPQSVLSALVAQYLAVKRQHEAAEEAQGMEDETDEERKASELLHQVEQTKPKLAPAAAVPSLRAVEASVPESPAAASPSPSPAPALAAPADPIPPPPLAAIPPIPVLVPPQGSTAPSTTPAVVLTTPSRGSSADPDRKSGPPLTPFAKEQQAASPVPPASPAASRPQQVGTNRARPRTVHRTTARRTAEIKKNINKKLLRQQLQEIKVQQQVQQKELDSLSGRQAEQKSRVNRFYNGKTAGEAARRAREEEQNTRRVASEREAEVRRFRSESEQLQRQQAAALRAWQREYGVQQKAAQKAFADALAERTRELKEHERQSEKDNKSMDKRLREQVKFEQKITRHQEEFEATSTFADQQDMQRLCDEHAQLMHHKDEAQELMLEQQAQHQSAEAHERVAAVQRALDAQRDQNALHLEWRTKLSEYEEEALKQMHQLLRDQLAARQQTEADQNKRMQMLDMRDFVKEMRESQKKQLQEFNNRMARELREASGDKKQLKQEQKAGKDEFMRDISRKEAESQQAKKKSMDEEDSEMREHMDRQRARLLESQEAELVALRERAVAAIDAMRCDHQRALEELEVRLCRERVAVAVQHQEEQLRLRARLSEERLAALAEFQRAELQVMKEKQAAALALLSKHHTEKLECMRTLHTVQQQLRLKELRKLHREGDINALVQLQEKEFERTKTGYAASQQSLSEEHAAQCAALVNSHKAVMQADTEAATKQMADLQHVQEQIMQRTKQEVAVVVSNHKYVKSLSGLDAQQPQQPQQQAQQNGTQQGVSPQQQQMTPPPAPSTPVLQQSQ